MGKDIETAVRSHEVCMKHSRAKPKKRPTNSSALPLGPEIPIHLCTKLATDSFQYNKRNYLFMLDYTSHFPVIHNLATARSYAVNDQCKVIFSKYCKPQELISDNNKCYISAKFAQFSRSTISHTPLSHHSTMNQMELLRSMLESLKVFHKK